MKETWQEIEGYEYYNVSNLGRVKRLPDGSRYTRKTEYILTPKYNRAGYTRVSLSKDGIVKDAYIHRLLAQAFIPNQLNKPTVNHINGIHDDNNLTNLEWATHSEQNYHMYNVLGRTMSDEHKLKLIQANTGRKMSNKSKLKISEANKGNIAWNKGKKLSPLSNEHKLKLSEAGKLIKRNRNEKGKFVKYN